MMIVDFLAALLALLAQTVVVKDSLYVCGG